MVARERGETRLTHIAGNQLPADDELSGKFAWLEDGIDLDRDLRGAFLRLQITLGDMCRASILLVQDPAILTDNTKAIAGLNGAYIMMPSVLTKNSGVCLKIKDAVKTRRKGVLDGRLSNRTSRDHSGCCSEGLCYVEAHRLH